MRFFGDDRLVYVKDYTEVSLADQIWQFDFITGKEYLLLKTGKQIVNFCFEKDIFYVMDEDATLTRFDSKSFKVVSTGLPSLPKYPDIAHDFKPFDMGYAYPMRVQGGVVAMISDVGLFLIEIINN